MSYTGYSRCSRTPRHQFCNFQWQKKYCVSCSKVPGLSFSPGDYVCAAPLEAQVRSFRFQKTQVFFHRNLTAKCSDLSMCPVSQEERRVACCLLIYAMQRKGTSGFMARAIASRATVILALLVSPSTASHRFQSAKRSDIEEA